MPTGFFRSLVLAIPVTLSVAAAEAQAPVAIFGRVEDATTLGPVEGARVLAGDSSSIAFTDAQGNFAIQLRAGSPHVLTVERLGYSVQRFDLPAEAAARVSVLRLDPEPVELDGVTVVAESDVEVMFQALASRRNAHSGPVQVLDRASLERFAPVGSAWDFVRQRAASRLLTCDIALSGLCHRGRAPLTLQQGVSVAANLPLMPARVCVDGWESFSAESELSSIDIGSVSLIEFYDMGQTIRVYTAAYLVNSARTGIYIPPTTEWGAPAGSFYGRC